MRTFNLRTHVYLILEYSHLFSYQVLLPYYSLFYSAEIYFIQLLESFNLPSILFYLTHILLTHILKLFYHPSCEFILWFVFSFSAPLSQSKVFFNSSLFDLIYFSIFLLLFYSYLFLFYNFFFLMNV